MLVFLLMADRRPRSRRLGYSFVEVVIILAIAGFVVCWILMLLPTGRETARQAQCQKNLMQIGIGVQLYEQLHHQYPAGQLTNPRKSAASPIQLMLDSLAIADFRDLQSTQDRPQPTGAPPPGIRIPGVMCPSDSGARSRLFPAAVSYRANVGDDFAGTNGPFRPDQAVAGATVEVADGLSYTAGLAERLVGTGRDESPDRANYRESLTPIHDLCESDNLNHAQWRGDAGNSWADSSWRSTLYSHAIPPNSTTSCIAQDGLTAAMTASSAHPARINVWMLDGSIRGITPTIHPQVWKALGSYDSTSATGDPDQEIHPTRNRVGSGR